MGPTDTPNPRRRVRDAVRRSRTGDERLTSGSLPVGDSHMARGMESGAVMDCGWGRLVFGHTFADHRELVDVLSDEEAGRRDICFYAPDPHVLVSRAPEHLFIDPSHTYRLRLHRLAGRPDPVPGIVVRQLTDPEDADDTNRIYASCGMVTAPTDTIWDNQRSGRALYLIAQDEHTGEVLGTVTGIDHVRVFDDPEHGTSLWCLAVDRQASLPGVGEALVRTLAQRFQARGRAYLDLSVLHDNAPAIALYRKLGFERVPVFAVKRKNPINERLFVAAASVEELDALNPYARIVADEAMRRGIAVRVVDAPGGYLELTHGGRTVVTRESLSELTSAVAMSRCDDKRVTRSILADAGLRVPRGRTASFDEQDEKFLVDAGCVVVKPARGEQGAGITVGIDDVDDLRAAVALARSHCPDVLIEEHVSGRDLRVVVIDHAVVAAAERKPASVVGDGRSTVRRLIQAQSRRRAAATGGESRIPLDGHTQSMVRRAGHELDDVLPSGERLRVRGTANLHTGGTIHDVTSELDPRIGEACVAASRAIDIPVVGMDLLVDDPAQPGHVFIEANERPGLANHEPQPTAERFIDLLFPGTRSLPASWDPSLTGLGEDHRP